jgi:hypothetical protein
MIDFAAFSGRPRDRSATELSGVDSKPADDLRL